MPNSGSNVYSGSTSYRDSLKSDDIVYKNLIKYLLENSELYIMYIKIENRQYLTFLFYY